MTVYEREKETERNTLIGIGGGSEFGLTAADFLGGDNHSPQHVLTF